MRIGIDCRTILNPEKGEAGGVGHYVYQLLRHLLKIDQQNEYVLFFDHRIKKKKIKKFSQKNVKFVFYPFFLYKKYIIKPISLYLFEAILKKERLDLFHLPTVPHSPQKLDIKTVVTVHDLAFLRLPNLFSKKDVEKKEKELLSFLPRVEKIITVSHSTKRDLEEILKIPSEKINVIYHGLDQRFFQKLGQEAVQKAKEKYKIKNDYFLFLSPLETRKNICRLISSFESFKEKVKKTPGKFPPNFQDIQLVLIGKAGSAKSKIKSKVKKSLYKKDIILTGYIPAEDVNALLEGAKVFIFPSLYEGFGLPVIEAMAKGVPVITSQLSSLPEIVGEGNAVFVNPYRISEITQALIDLLVDEEKQQRLRKRAFLKAQEYRWERTAEETLKTYQSLISFNK
ncbi:MAG: glycosyltransferase family 4 protein [Patescibacteria group bacterium]|nr:glycosyltransferase family 4 protein [Patescibacteria group bacterium]